MNPSHRSLPPRVDPFELVQKDDPYRVYAELRQAGPLLRGGVGAWVVPRYQEVAALLRDARLGPFQFLTVGTGADGSIGDGPAHSFLQRIVVAADGEAHARVRKVLGRGLTPRGIRELRQRVELHVEALLAGVAERGSMEVVRELAYPVPLRVVSELLSIPAEDRDAVGRHVLKLSRVFAPTIDGADRDAADSAVVWLRQVVARQLASAAERPSDDVVSGIAAAQAAGLMSREECVDNLIFLIFAGLETSMNLIAAGCAALSRHPEQFAALCRSPESVAATAVDEFLRYDAPTQMTARIVRDSIEIAGRNLSPGRVLLLLLGSANHDEAAFRNPEQLDVTRQPNPHLSFGAGLHYCVGAGVARMESEVLFAALARRFVSFEPDGEIVREPTATPRIYSRVPIALRSR
jgi:cytochrome P450